jgi:hypothetical protein
MPLLVVAPDNNIRVFHARDLLSYVYQMNILVECVGVFAFITNVIGNLLLARKSERGWWIRIVSIVAWFIYAQNTASLAMTLNSITFFGINIYGLLKWRAERLAKQKEAA